MLVQNIRGMHSKKQLFYLILPTEIKTSDYRCKRFVELKIWLWKKNVSIKFASFFLDGRCWQCFYGFQNDKFCSKFPWWFSLVHHKCSWILLAAKLSNCVIRPFWLYSIIIYLHDCETYRLKIHTHFGIGFCINVFFATKYSNFSKF